MTEKYTDILRVGVVGIGNMGGTHAVQIFEKKVRGAELTAVCDISGERLELAKKRF